MPFVRYVIPILESLPCAAISGGADVALPAIAKLLTAEGTAVNVNTAFPLESLICTICGVVIVGDVEPTKLPVPVCPLKLVFTALIVAIINP